MVLMFVTEPCDRQTHLSIRFRKRKELRFFGALQIWRWGGGILKLEISMKTQITDSYKHLALNYRKLRENKPWPIIPGTTGRKPINLML
jgi:hypothetical protein